MCIAARLAAVAILACSSMTTARAETGGAVAGSEASGIPTRQRFETLVSKLGSESYDEREAAHEALLHGDSGILSWIESREAVEQDLEIRLRLAEIRQILQTRKDSRKFLRQIQARLEDKMRPYVIAGQWLEAVAIVEADKEYQANKAHFVELNKRLAEMREKARP